MVFDTFSDTQTLCRPDRHRNTTCCFSDGAFLFGSDIIRFRSGMKAMTAPRHEARSRQILPRQKYIFPFSEHKEV